METEAAVVVAAVEETATVEVRIVETPLAAAAVVPIEETVAVASREVVVEVVDVVEEVSHSQFTLALQATASSCKSQASGQLYV